MGERVECGGRYADARVMVETVSWFGPEAWSAEINERPLVDIPDEPCDWCEEGFHPMDRGVYVGRFLDGAEKPIYVPLHLCCYTRIEVGSIGHQKGMCPCVGGNTDDPPEMSLREAAEGAVLLYLDRVRPIAA